MKWAHALLLGSVGALSLSACGSGNRGAGGNGADGGVTDGGTTGGGTFDVAAFLSHYGPLTAHEGDPHGVPSTWAWARQSTSPRLTPPPNTGNLNWWGIVYVDTSDYHAPNTRVEVTGGKLLVLYQGDNRWHVYQVTNDYGGGSWTEDFSAACPTKLNARKEGPGIYSLVPAEGCNSHFWPNLPFQPITGTLRAVVSLSAFRAVLDNPSGADNRARSKYLLEMGSDWRAADGSCPKNSSGVTACAPVEVGRFLYARSQWRLGVMSTMTASDLASLPMPPATLFRLPDGTYPQ